MGGHGGLSKTLPHDDAGQDGQTPPNTHTFLSFSSSISYVYPAVDQHHVTPHYLHHFTESSFTLFSASPSLLLQGDLNPINLSTIHPRLAGYIWIIIVARQVLDL